MGQTLSLVSRIVALSGVLFVALSVSAVVSGVAQPAPAGTQPSSLAGDAASDSQALLVFCALAAAVFAWMILRSRLSGWRLVGAVCLAYFGLGTLLPQSESVLFLPRHLPPGFVARLFVMGALCALLFAPAAVWTLGRHRRIATPGPPPPPASGTRWLRLAYLAAAYVALYFIAGYFIAYRNPELVAYYGDTDPGSFLAQMTKISGTAPWLFPFQALRGVLWVLFVMPFLLTFKGRAWELPLMIASAYCVWALVLLAPNPYMPESIRMSHLVETGLSGLVFGGLVGVAFAPSPPSARHS